MEEGREGKRKEERERRKRKRKEGVVGKEREKGV